MHNMFWLFFKYQITSTFTFTLATMMTSYLCYETYQKKPNVQQVESEWDTYSHCFQYVLLIVLYKL